MKTGKDPNKWTPPAARRDPVRVSKALRAANKAGKIKPTAPVSAAKVAEAAMRKPTWPVKERLRYAPTIRIAEASERPETERKSH